MSKTSDIHARVKEHLEGLARAVDAKAHEEGFQEALRAMAIFWRYKYFNQSS